MDIQLLKRSLISVYKNIPGKSVRRQIVVIEADDWGSIRMPSKETHSQLLKAGLPVNESRYERNDTVEDSSDLEALFAILSRYQDNNGQSPVMSPFCNVANPDFKKIEASEFQEYYFEKFTDTYKRYSRSENIMTLWNQGIKENIFVPEFHGREHIATNLWLKSLQNDDAKLKIAFQHDFVCYTPSGIPAVAKDFRPNFYINSSGALEDLKQSITQGVEIFKQEFLMSPVVFNAPNGVFIPEFNQTLVNAGINYNAVPRKRYDRDKEGTYRYNTYSTGQKSKEGLTFYVRNCNFEPTEKGYKDISHVMSQIQGAFLCGKAAVIGTHRVNFVGGINEANRKQGLKELDDLLKNILKRWPDVEFMSSREFTKLLS